MHVSQQIFSELYRCGVRQAFGVPGSQNIAFYNSAKLASIDIDTLTHELAAGFAALGYGRVSSHPAVLVTIPGPGLAYAVTPLAEAKVDSVPIVLVVQRSSVRGGPDHQLQALDELALLAPVSKSVLEIKSRSDVSGLVSRAVNEASSEPAGPVVLLVDKELSTESAATNAAVDELVAASQDYSDLDILQERLAGCNKVLFYVGHAVDRVSEDLIRLAENLGAFVIATPGARGVIPESHSLYVQTDKRSVSDVNALLEKFDLVVAFGIRFSHSNTFGFKLKIRGDQLVNINRESLPERSQYSGSQIKLSSADSISYLAAKIDSSNGSVVDSASRIGGIPIKTVREPDIVSEQLTRLPEFFQALRKLLPKSCVVVTDSGNHQFFVRRHFLTERPAGLITPAEFQSMGFAIAAAFGAKRAEPGSMIIAILGDGGLQMSGMELATLVQARIGLPIFVFRDGRFGLIYDQQIQRFGQPLGTELQPLDYASFAASFGAQYERFDGDLENVLSRALKKEVPTLIEVELVDSSAMKANQFKASVKKLVRKVLPGKGAVKNP